MADDSTEVKEYSGKWWINEIAQAEKALDERWRDSGDKVVNAYLDRSEDQMGTERKKYNVFWANVSILKSALYANPPRPRVSRQNGDAKDDVARTAALILQRMLEIDLTKDQSCTHASLKAAVEDRLIPGMGQVWPRYEVVTEKYTVPAPLDPLTGLPLGEPVEAERIVAEEVVVDYVHWRDFIWSPARMWKDVWWVARRIWMKKRDFAKRWGEKKLKEFQESVEAEKSVTKGVPKGFKKGRIEVFEIWCEDTNKVYWCSPFLEECLETKDDPLLLEDFFPCPPPLLATHTTNDLTPRPDYVMIQDQYEELNTLNDRIYTLTKALRVVGVYDQNTPEIAAMVTGSEFNMIPVENWAMLAERGGLKGMMDWFPIEQVQKVLSGLMEQRIAVISQIYELTSISDIMRGSSNPRETAKAQTLKAQYSSVRLQLTQGEVAEFVQGVLRIKAEIIAKHFQPETIIKQSQIEFTESAPYAQQAVKLIQDWEASRYRIEVTEESLSLADYNAERELRMELATAIGQFLSQSASMVQGMPAALPYLLRIIQWVISAFRGSDDIEQVLDDAIAAAAQLPNTPPGQGQKPPPPDPEQVEGAKAKAQMAIDNNQLRNDLTLVKAEGIRDILTQEPRDVTPRLNP